MDQDRMTSDVSRNFVRCTSLSKGDVIMKTVVPAFSISHWAILGSDVGSDDEDGLKGAIPAFHPHNLQLKQKTPTAPGLPSPPSSPRSSPPASVDLQ